TSTVGTPPRKSTCSASVVACATSCDRCARSSSTVLMYSAPVIVAMCCTYCTSDWYSVARSSFSSSMKASLSMCRAVPGSPPGNSWTCSAVRARECEQEVTLRVGPRFLHHEAGFPQLVGNLPACELRRDLGLQRLARVELDGHVERADAHHLRCACEQVHLD